MACGDDCEAIKQERSGSDSTRSVEISLSAPSINTLGMTIPLSYTKPAHVLNGLASRAINPCTALYHYESGKLVQVGKSVDMLNTAANRVQCTG